MSKEIIIEINESGDCSLEGKGFVGAECDKILQEIEMAIGKSSNRTKKPEYNQRSIKQNRQQTRG